MPSSNKSSNTRLALYSAPFAIGTIAVLGNTGGIDIPNVEVLTSIKSILGDNGFKVASESLKLIGSLGGGLLTTEGHDRIKQLLGKLNAEELYTNKRLEESIKKTIIKILETEKSNPTYEKHTENIERVINALDRYYDAITNIEPEEINTDIFYRIFDSFKYNADNLSKESSPLNANEWKTLLTDTAIITDINNFQSGVGFKLELPKDFDITLTEISETLEIQFPKTFQNYLEKDFAENKETYAKFVLDFLKRINNSGDEIKEILTEQKITIAQIKQNTSLGLQQGQINHAEIRNYLDKVSIQIENLQNFSTTSENGVTQEEVSKLNEEIRQGFQTYGNQISLLISELRTMPVKVVDEFEKRGVIGKKTKPKGFINSPRQEEEYFVEQGKIFERLDTHLEKYHIGYLHGTHGLGKTTTVIQYGYARKQDYDFVLYILATDAGIENEMAFWADKYVEGVSPSAEPHVKAKALKVWLEDETLWVKEDKNWLIIFDNLESVDKLNGYFPITKKGDVLYTCNKDIRRSTKHQLEFEQFTQEEAELFVYRKRNEDEVAKYEDIPKTDLAEIKELTNTLGRLPLALSVASAYMLETKKSYLQYVEMLKANPRKNIKGQIGSGNYQHDTVYDAFLISINEVTTPNSKFEDSEIISKLAETFLNLLIFYAPEDIPEELLTFILRDIIESSDSKTPINSLFEETVALLENLTLSKREHDRLEKKNK